MEAIQSLSDSGVLLIWAFLIFAIQFLSDLGGEDGELSFSQFVEAFLASESFLFLGLSNIFTHCALSFIF
jgi:hypothetical protein